MGLPQDKSLNSKSRCQSRVLRRKKANDSSTLMPGRNRHPGRKELEREETWVSVEGRFRLTSTCRTWIRALQTGERNVKTLHLQTSFTSTKPLKKPTDRKRCPKSHKSEDGTLLKLSLGTESQSTRSGTSSSYKSSGRTTTSQHGKDSHISSKRRRQLWSGT